MISSLIEWPHRSTCHHPSRHNRGEATGTWIPRQIEDIPSIISIQSASNSLIALIASALSHQVRRSVSVPAVSGLGRSGYDPGSLRLPRLEDDSGGVRRAIALGVEAFWQCTPQPRHELRL